VPRAESKPSALLHALEELSRRYDRRFLDSDPVGIVRRFDDPKDREIVGLIAAGLAYGRVASIRGSLQNLLGRLGPRPSRFVASFDPARDAALFDGFVHRFTRGRDIALLLHLVRQVRERAGSLESFFVEGDLDPKTPTLGPALDSFGARLFALDARPFVRDGVVPRRDGARWLLPLPAGGSACKRSCLFLRWMVRPDDGVDCGVWPRVSPSRLVLPLDTHLLRVVQALGWTRRKSPGWPMALEATARLRALDPADPIRFDFALSRLGILGLLDAQGGRLTARVVRSALTSR
jgi:uncharacterized protein (TIGR02757 family)